MGAPERPSTEILVGRVLGGRYRIVREIGHGGTGVVFEAIQENLRRRVALKVLRPHHRASACGPQRFEAEARMAAALEHPNIVPVIDFQMSGDEPPFLVMEYVQGDSLRTLLRRHGAMEPRRAAFIFAQVLSALEVAHQARIVHRDVKPANVMLTSTSVVADIAKVVDFGIAKSLHEARLAAPGVVLGTLAYMSPEQASARSIDERADVYAVGASLFHCITGRHIFKNMEGDALMEAILTCVPPRLDLMVPGVDGELASIVARALEKDPAERFESAASMADALTEWSASSQTDPPTLRVPLHDPRRQAHAASMHRTGVTTM